MRRFTNFLVVVFLAAASIAVGQTTTPPSPASAPEPAAKRRAFDQFDLINAITEGTLEPDDSDGGVFDLKTRRNNPPRAYLANTDRKSRLNLPLTGSADLTVSGRGQGYVFNDPAYGTRILRVTDRLSTYPENTSGSFITSSNSETRTWNSDSTRFYLMSLGGGIFIYDFNAADFLVSRPGNTSNSVKGLSLLGVAYGEPSWSKRNRDWLYAVNDYEIRRFDMSGVTAQTNTPPYTVILDVRSIYAAVNGGTLSGYMGRPTVSDTAPETIALAFGGNQDTWRYYLRFNISTGEYKVLDTGGGPYVRIYDSRTGAWTSTSYAAGWQMHNGRIDMTGRYIIVTRTAIDIPPGEGILEVWDTELDTVVNIPLAHNPEGHMAMGYSNMVNFSGDPVPVWDSAQWWKRDLSALTSEVRLMTPTLVGSGAPDGAIGSIDEHSSWHNARASYLFPVISATYRYQYPPNDPNHSWRAWDGELIGVRTDGVTPTIWRFMQHHSVTWDTPGRTTAFEDIPIPQVSPNGRYALIHTNWNLTLGTDSQSGRAGRSDVFLVELAP